MGSMPHNANDIDTSQQHKHFLTNLTMYVSTNTSTKELSSNYAHNADILDHASETRPHSSGVQRKIVKSNDHYNMSSYVKPQKMEQVGNLINNTSLYNEMNETATLPHSNSSSSLDFLAEGERMVSELCSVPSEPQPRPRRAESGGERGERGERGEAARAPSADWACANCSCQKSRTELYRRELLAKAGSVAYDESVPLQIIQMAVEACTVAENIAMANKNRPCFKNIQTICEKTRSNVQKPDSAVANLNSQGVPWVIKNFIFSFVRILDGWKGIKELLCEKHESFKRIENKYYNPHIRESFVEWQIATKKMLNHIYKTFKALDSGFQAEQQRYKQNAAGLNFSALHNINHKQQTKQAAQPSGIGQQSYSSPASQWAGGSYAPPAPYLAPGMPQWAQSATAANVPMMQAVFKGSLTKIENDANKRPNSITAEAQETKEEVKIALGNTFKCSESWVHQQNNDLLLKYQHTPNNVSKIDEFSKLTMGNELQKMNSTETVSTVPETMFNVNEIRDNLPMLSTNYWPNDNLSSVMKTSKFNELDTFPNRNNSVSFSQNTLFSNNIITGPPAFESDNDVSDTLRVYMKPGSYNVPIKQCESLPEAEFGTLETMTVHNSLITKGSVSRVPNLTYTKSSPATFNKSLIDGNNYSISKKIQPVEQIASSRNTQLHTMNSEGYATCSDKEWETAKQMAPKLLTTVYLPDDPKSNAQRLYEALSSGSINSRPADTNVFCGDSVSWNKVSQEFFGDVNQVNTKVCDGEVHTDIGNSKDAMNISKGSSGDKKLAEQEQYAKEDLSENQGDALYTNESSDNISYTNSSKAVIGDSCCVKREYLSCDSLKTLKKKTTGRKNIDVSGGTMKKMENILIALWNRDKRNDSKLGLDISKAPHYFEVVKNPLMFSNISERIQNSYYTDVHQVAHDIRSIFYNAYEYLKVYPDMKLKNQVDEACAYFEKLFTENILNANTLKDKNKKPKSRIEIYDEKRMNMFHLENKKITEKEKCQS